MKLTNGQTCSRRSRSNRVTTEVGQTLVLFAFMLAALGGLVALVIDVGMVYTEKRQGQNAVDAASLAAVLAMAQDEATEEDAIAEATSYLASNGIDVSAVEVTVEIPPVTGDHAGQDDCAEVVLSSTTNGVFSRLVGQESFDVESRAVACATSAVTGNYGIIALNEEDCRSIDLNGTIDIEITGAGIWANSDCQPDAFYANGNVSVDAEIINVMGGCEVTGVASINPSCTHPTTLLPDPLAGVTEPFPPSGPNHTCPDSGTRTLQPGVYNCELAPSGNADFTFEPGNYLFTGGIRLQGNVQMTLNPGIYTVRGSGLSVSGGAQMTANEVMFFVDQGSLNLAGTADLDITAPTMGPYAGIAFFQARDNTSQVTMHGTAAAGNWGTVYAKTATVEYQGTAETSYQFIVDKFTTGGTTATQIVFDNNFLVESPPQIKLVE